MAQSQMIQMQWCCQAQWRQVLPQNLMTTTTMLLRQAVPRQTSQGKERRREEIRAQLEERRAGKGRSK